MTLGSLTISSGITHTLLWVYSDLTQSLLTLCSRCTHILLEVYIHFTTILLGLFSGFSRSLFWVLFVCLFFTSRVLLGSQPAAWGYLCIPPCRGQSSLADPQAAPGSYVQALCGAACPQHSPDSSHRHSTPTSLTLPSPSVFHTAHSQPCSGLCWALGLDRDQAGLPIPQCRY